MEETVGYLIQLGLTKSQAKILYHLQKFNQGSVQDIAKATGLHRQQTYPVLKELQSMGLIEKNLGRPNKFRALPLEQIFKILLDQKTKLINELQEKTTQIIKELRETEKPKDEPTFSVITGYTRLMHALYSWGDNAEKIDMIIKFDRMSQQLNRKLEAEKTKYTNVKEFRIVTEDTKNKIPISKNIKNIVQVRFSKATIPVEVGIYDNKRAHLIVVTNRDCEDLDQISCLTSNHPCFVSMLQNYFDTLWKEGTPQKINKTQSPATIN